MAASLSVCLRCNQFLKVYCTILSGFSTISFLSQRASISLRSASFLPPELTVKKLALWRLSGGVGVSARQNKCIHRTLGVSLPILTTLA